MEEGFRFIWIAVFLLINLRTFVILEAQPICFGDGNYTANSVYQRNLNSLLSSLPANIGISGFLNSSVGQDPDLVFAAALCRADMQLEDCRNCIQNATVEILNSCPLRMRAILFTENCSVRFMNVSIFGILSRSPMTGSYNSSYAYSSQQFNYDLRQLLDNLFHQAAAGGPVMKVAAGNRTGPASQTIYSMVQCTPDISRYDCHLCLSSATAIIPWNTPRIGLTSLSSSCKLQYETYPFFNLSRIQEVEALLSDLLPPRPSPVTRGRVVIASTVVAACGLLFLAACSVFIILRRRRLKIKKNTRGTTSNDDEISTVESLLYDFEKIRAATDDFSRENELGHGGFGVVYKGRLENGVDIAVKKLLRNSAQGDVEFKNEVVLMAKLQHRNLLKLIGYTVQGTDKLLIFEYIQNSSLDHFIFDPVKRTDMDWERRYKIIEGIARGLLYLHEGSRYRIIHRDLKAANVLIDNEMNPKIADFGLAKLFMMDQSEVRTNRRVGTYGYMAPEYVFHGTLSLKMDVFSFGVLVLEIVSGRKISSNDGDEVEEDLRSFAWSNWKLGTAENIIDPTLRDDVESVSDMMRCIQIGLLCVEENPSNRPTMASVVFMLKASSTPMAAPSQPGFTLQGSSDFGKLKEMAVDPSMNYASITEVYPR